MLGSITTQIANMRVIQGQNRKEDCIMVLTNVDNMLSTVNKHNYGNIFHLGIRRL